MKRLIALLSALIISINILSPAVSAIDEDDVIHQIIDTNDPAHNARAATLPTKFHNLGSGVYVAQINNLAAGMGSYTKCYFSTTTGTIRLDCHLERAGTGTDTGRILVAYLYDYTTNALIGSRTFVFTSTEVDYTGYWDGLGFNGLYYIYFYNASSTDPSSSKDLQGKITIKQK